VLFGAACIALGETGTAAEALALPAQAVLPAARRCPYCGSIESKRFGDGSSRVFQEELPVSWRLGERLIFIDGLHK
jgi:hypothetical protein